MAIGNKKTFLELVEWLHMGLSEDFRTDPSRDVTHQTLPGQE